MLRSVTGEVRNIPNTTGLPSSTPPRPFSQRVTPVLAGSPVIPTGLIDTSTLVDSRTLVDTRPLVHTKPQVQIKPKADKRVRVDTIALVNDEILLQKQPVARKESPACIESLVNPSFSYSDFAKQLALKPGATGAIAPSSKLLAKRTIKQANLEEAKMVVELGPGTGVFTEEILKNIRCDQSFFAIELNHTFVSATKSRCPEACVYHDSASSLPLWLEKHNSPQADCIISSLPWTIFDKPEQNEMMSVISDSLSEGGVFVSIIYLGAKCRSRGRYFINNLQHHFSSVTQTPTVWQNLPPSQIFRCVK